MPALPAIPSASAPHACPPCPAPRSAAASAPPAKLAVHAPPGSPAPWAGPGAAAAGAPHGGGRPALGFPLQGLPGAPPARLVQRHCARRSRRPLRLAHVHGHGLPQRRAGLLAARRAGRAAGRPCEAPSSAGLLGPGSPRAHAAQPRRRAGRLQLVVAGRALRRGGRRGCGRGGRSGGAGAGAGLAQLGLGLCAYGATACVRHRSEPSGSRM